MYPPRSQFCFVWALDPISGSDSIARAYENPLFGLEIVKNQDGTLLKDGSKPNFDAKNAPGIGMFHESFIFAPSRKNAKHGLSRRDYQNKSVYKIILHSFM